MTPSANPRPYGEGYTEGKDPYGPGTPLTPRETEVVLAVAHGWTRAEIAHRLGISTQTVSSHVSHIHSKLDVDNAISMLQKAGIIVLPGDEEMAWRVDVAGVQIALTELQARVAALVEGVPE